MIKNVRGNPTISVAPMATVVDQPLTMDAHRKAWRRQPDFPTTDVVKLVSGTNPWRHHSLGWKFYELVLRHHPEATVAELIEWSKPHVIGAMEVQEHLRWLFTWGGSYVAINGELYSPVPVAEVVEVVPRARKKKAMSRAG
jgi:hypothetical protein